MTFIVGLATALWSANAGIKSLFDALNLVNKEPEKRSFITLNAISLSFTLAAIVFVPLALGAMVVLPIVLNYLGIAAAAELATKVLRWPALFIVVMFGLALVYRYGPSRSKPKWRWITWGTAGRWNQGRDRGAGYWKGHSRKQTQGNLRFIRDYQTARHWPWSFDRAHHR
jgi:membrane protein